MSLAFLAFFGGFIGLIGGGELLVFATTGLAISLNVSQSVVATIIIAFGSSLPELLISVFAAMSGNSDLALGNVVGSNIQNIALIIGISALVRPFATDIPTIKKNALIFLGSPLLLITLAYDGSIGRAEALVLLAAFSIFIALTVFYSKKEKQPPKTCEQAQEMSLKKLIFELLAIGLGLALLFFSAKLVLFGATAIANHLGLSQRIIGLTIVAFGTSLPELFICVVAAYRNKSDIIVGNIIGSNIYNILAILGISALITPMNVEQKTIHTDMLAMTTFSVAGYLIFRYAKIVSRLHAVALLVSLVTISYFILI